MKPYGNKAIESSRNKVFLLFEEYEAIRLCDYILLNHQDASQIMEVSRPTLTRIYASARQKIADALVEGKQIIIEGGKVYFDSDWYTCDGCGCFFNHPEKSGEVTACPLCNSAQISNYDLMDDPQKKCDYPQGKMCVCPKCGFFTEGKRGDPCKVILCPTCGIHLVRKDDEIQNQPRKKKYV